jgi:hypothetical protein
MFSRTARASDAAVASAGWVLVGVLAVLAACAVVAAPVQAKTVASISPSFSPDRLGARTAATFTVRFAGGTNGVPLPVRRAVVQVPGGLSVELPNTRGCTQAQLQAHGPSGCPARSQIGSGHAVVEVHAGSQTIDEDATLWAFLGPLRNAQPTLEILGQGYTPLDERVVFPVSLQPDSAPYWGKLVAQIPAIPTVPLEPDASATFFSLTLGTSAPPRTPGTIAIFAPRRCPAGGFPWAAEFTYADGSTDTTTTTTPCP